MSEPTSYNSVRRALKLLKALRGRTVDGVSVTELAQATGESVPNVSRMLAFMAGEGFVTKLETGHYAHSIQLLQMAQAHAEHMARLQDRLAEINRRVLAGAQR